MSVKTGQAHPGKNNGRSDVDLTCSQSDDPARPSTKATPHPLGMLLPYARAPPIRTFTVGAGISPDQPPGADGRVADYHRRFGITPTPEHEPPVCTHPYLAALVSAGTLIRTAPGLVHKFLVGR